MRRFSRAQRVLLWRAKNVPLSYEEIGREFSISGKRAGDLFKQAVEDCWRTACSRARVSGASITWRNCASAIGALKR
jgi:hypothetical protein